MSSSAPTSSSFDSEAGHMEFELMILNSNLHYPGPTLFVTPGGESTEYTVDVDLEALSETSSVVVKSGKWAAVTRDGKRLEVG